MDTLMCMTLFMLPIVRTACFKFEIHVRVRCIFLQLNNLIDISATYCRPLTIIWAVVMPTARRNFEC